MVIGAVFTTFEKGQAALIPAVLTQERWMIAGMMAFMTAT